MSQNVERDNGNVGRAALDGLSACLGQRRALKSLAALLTAVALVNLAPAFWYLLGSSARMAAVDIIILHRNTQAWFAGTPIYFIPHPANYPPATWLTLWPVFGWTTIGTARMVWAVLDVIGLVALGVIFAGAVGARNRLVWTCAMLAPLSLPATGDVVAVGQLTIVVLPLALGAILLAVKQPPSWGLDVVIALMFEAALVKPTVAAPLFLVLLIVPRRIRPAVLTAVGYAGLTLFALRFQHGGFLAQLRRWQEIGLLTAGQGYGNVQDGLSRLGWSVAFVPIAVTALVGLGIWIWRSRRQDVWLLLAVSAIVARILPYHRVYDDALLIVPMIALARLASAQTAHSSRKVPALAMLGVLAAVLWMPVSLYYYGNPWSRIFTVSHSGIVLVILISLVVSAWGSPGLHKEA